MYVQDSGTIVSQTLVGEWVWSVLWLTGGSIVCNCVKGGRKLLRKKAGSILYDALTEETLSKYAPAATLEHLELESIRDWLVESVEWNDVAFVDSWLPKGRKDQTQFKQRADHDLDQNLVPSLLNLFFNAVIDTKQKCNQLKHITAFFDTLF